MYITLFFMPCMHSRDSPECDFISVIIEQEAKVDKAENTGVRMSELASK